MNANNLNATKDMKETRMNPNYLTTAMKDKKVMLSTVWLFAMLNYTYGDVVTLMDPVKHGTMQLTEVFLLGASILMEIPIAMILLSRVLNYRSNRWANIITGTIMTAFLTMTLFVAVPTMYYAFWSVIEIASTLFIVWTALTWRNADNQDKGVGRGIEVLAA